MSGTRPGSAGDDDRLALQGSWQLLSYELRSHDGEVVHPMGRRPEGLLLYDPFGNLAVHLMQPGARVPAAQELPPGVPPAMAFAYACYSSYFGRYCVDSERRRITHHITGASIPEWAGTEFARNYALDGDRLTLAAAVDVHGTMAVLVWQRAA